MALVTPKHTGELYTFFASLEVLSNHESWIDNETFKSELFELYVKSGQQNEYIIISGKPAKKPDESDYTKDLQLPMYFGFAEADSFMSNSSKRITSSGRLLLNAYKNQNEDSILSLFLDSIKNCSFGRNNFGCIRSDSDYEAPAILFRSIILLNGVSTKEFAYILRELDYHGRDFSEIISELSISREVPSFGISFGNLNTDMKFITLFCKLGFLFRDESQRLQLSPKIKKADIYQIPIMNTKKSTNMINDNSQLPDEFNVSIESKHRQFITAIKTKPFLLLAGISGTGKSRIVREFAFKSCPKYLQDKEGATPGNYCMIEVKPNWHDSTELLGYYSNLSKSYQFKKFVKFLVKAKMFPDVPFFVCLDEMNLAPVEQYFAEFLSILETRKHPKKADGGVDMNTISTGVIVEAKYFRELSTMSSAINQQTGEAFDQKLTDRDIYLKLFNIDSESDISEDVGSRTDLTTIGLTLPDNVIIIGTVNMDDTTHQFSRKVIDRAMTIEMNGGKLVDMFGGSKDLEYLEDEEEQKKWQHSFSQRYVTADEVLDAHPEQAEDIKRILPERLESINMALKGTPFEVSYRVLNELTIMVGVMLDDKKEEESLDDIINQAVNNILLMKILPRIEGDAEMFALSKAYKDKLGITYNDRLEWLKALAPDIVQAEDTQDESGEGNAGAENGSEKQPEDKHAHYQTAKDKIQEMIERLNNQDFTRFWP